MPAPREVRTLVQRFQENRASYLSHSYNETQTRIEFVDPFFTALGWDVANVRGYAEAYKDVVHEDAIVVGGMTKAPDYSFRVGGARKFFVETKRPGVKIKDDAGPAFQLRRYAWSAKLPLSILTNFAELAVYDCRVKPERSDPASAARILYLSCDEYEARWDELSGIFGKGAVLTGSFDRYAESTKAKRGTAEVDDAFLAEIEGWREALARNFALRNPDLSQREVNFAVQRTMDRIIFLRICEDRGIEPYGGLQALLNGQNIYGRLGQLFRRADERYNSGLFHFRPEKGRPEPPDELTLGLAVDDKVLKDILRRLYYPDSPYEFSVLPADILGQVYEQFLGKVIRLTPGHRAVVEEKPEVRKAGGVYYTPTYIVDYIVEHTVGKLLEGKTPQEVGGFTQAWKRSAKLHPLRVLDPACGSGSFLLGAYQYLLDWYRDRYVEDGPAKHAKGRNPRLYRVGLPSPAGLSVPPSPPRGRGQGEGGQREGAWRLTTAERKRILLTHIYGVDVDPQAVEVTKLSLLLKVLEGETQETLDSFWRLFQERALPDLGANIKCGNSLIGPDFFAGAEYSLLDEEERYRINPFDWRAEFPDVFPFAPSPLAGEGRGEGAIPSPPGQGSGFDAVIGNPPYIRMEAFKELKDYLRARYRVHDERSDLYVYFIEREHELLREGGMFGMIVSNKFLRAGYGNKVRELLSEVATVHRIVDLAGLPVFAGATVRTIVLITSKGRTDAPAAYSPPPERERFIGIESGSTTLGNVVVPLSYELPQAALSAGSWNLTAPHKAVLVEQLRLLGQPLIEVVNGRICRGIVSGLTAAFVISGEQRDAILRINPEADEIIRSFLQGRSIRRYRVEVVDEYLIYTHHGIDMAPYPAVLDHLRPFKSQLEGRATQQAWYELQQPQFAYKELLERPKIVFPDIATSCRFSLDHDGHFSANTVYFLPTDDLRLLGLLNSRLAHFYFAQVCAALEGPGEAYLRFFGQYLEGFPVHLPDPVDKARHGKMVALVQTMLDLHKRLAAAKTAHEKDVLQRRITATDRQIDQLVYALYGLTDEDIKMVEEGTARA